MPFLPNTEQDQKAMLAAIRPTWPLPTLSFVRIRIWRQPAFGMSRGRRASRPMGVLLWAVWFMQVFPFRKLAPRLQVRRQKTRDCVPRRGTGGGLGAASRPARQIAAIALI
jgi:hypothetical protein